MKTIWKLTAKVDDIITLSMPVGAEVISVSSQRPEWISIWAIVDTTMPVHQRAFRVIGTGNPMSGEPMQFIGTVFDRVFVWHVFEVEV